MTNPTGKIELYKDNTFSITGEVPNQLKEYLHTKVELSVEYRHGSLAQFDKAEISLLNAMIVGSAPTTITPSMEMIKTIPTASDWISLMIDRLFMGSRGLHFPVTV